MLIMAKTKKKVPYADEVESSEDSENFEDLIKEARGEDEQDTFANMNDMKVSFN